ncbi:Transposable element tcb2 transposase [Caligus rogercresseyi]|uniref:Transposable element tcb2 transposase n=1 Tax=Caligus rogercresseyi TaxID=217165 RepID=A0A7T8QUF1_CALRO|nr:Transposable element tcb2 transposase [Caligus rogercresseyi]
MSSELGRKTAIIVALCCGPTVYSIAKSFKESEDIEEGFLTPERKFRTGAHVLEFMSSEGDIMPPHFFAKVQNVNKEVYLDVMPTVVNPWMTQIATGRPYLYQQDGAPARTSNLVQNWCLENLDMFWSKEFWPPTSPDLTPCDYYLWGVLERDTNKCADNTVDSLKAAIIQAVANLSREQVAHAVGRFRHRVETVIVKGESWIE